MKIIIFIIFSIQTVIYAESIVVANKGDHTASIVSVETGETKILPVGYLPHEVAISQNFAFISNYGHQHVRSTSLKNKPGNTISMVNLSNLTDIKSIHLGPGLCAPHGMATSKDNKYVYITCEGRQEIAVVDIQKAKFVKNLRTNQPGTHMLVTDSKNRLFATNFWSGTISVINTQTGTLIKQIMTGRTTEGIGLSPDEKWLYVTVAESNELVKISTESLKVIHKVKLEDRTSPLRVEVSNDGSFLIVNQTGKNSVGIFDSETLNLLKEIPVGNQPIGLTISRKLNRAYVANMKDGSVSIIDLNKKEVIKSINIGSSLPDGLAVIH